MNAVSHRHGDEAEVLGRPCLCSLLRCLRLLGGRALLLGHLEQLLLMLQPHVVDLHVGKCSILQCLLDGQTRVIGMYVHLYYILICHTYNRIAYRLQICLEIHLHLDVEGFVQHNNELGTVPELDFRLFLRILSGSVTRRLHGRRLHGEIDLLAQIGVQSPCQNLHQPLPAGVHHSCLLKHRQHLRGLTKNVSGMLDDTCQKGLHVIAHAVRRQRLGLVRRPSGHSENRSLLGLHHRLVRGLHGLIQSLH